MSESDVRHASARVNVLLHVTHPRFCLVCPLIFFFFFFLPFNLFIDLQSESKYAKGWWRRWGSWKRGGSCIGWEKGYEKEMAKKHDASGNVSLIH